MASVPVLPAKEQRTAHALARTPSWAKRRGDIALVSAKRIKCRIARTLIRLAAGERAGALKAGHSPTGRSAAAGERWHGWTAFVNFN